MTSRRHGGARAARPKSPLCHTCGKRIRVPKGWDPGSAVRKHYWAKHRDHMLRGKGGR
jgi:hypothetical protein